MEKVTRENCEKLNNFEHVFLKNADKTRLRAKRNGKTRLWKRNPERFVIPIKHGLYDFGYINQFDCENWEGK